MQRIVMPAAAEKIINTLYEKGYEASIVGGCVRDLLLSKTPDDFDITTNAKPEDIKRIFERTVDTGIAHGTVTVIMNGDAYEVTTYRVDGEYKDNRHPVSVSYTADIKEDLARRDFTVNALAYNNRSGIIDAFSGIQDLKDGIIRCVRNPEERFSEDALRVLRGIRFASTLGFKIEENTARAIKVFAKNLVYVSKERIFTEWKKLLSGKNAYDVILEYGEVVKIILPGFDKIKLPPREKFDTLSWDERQLALFAMSSNTSGFENAAKELKMDSKTRDIGISVLKNMPDKDEMSDEEIRAFLISLDDDVSLKCMKVAAVIGKIPEPVFEKTKTLIEMDVVRKVSQLKVGGKDLVATGLRGEAIGRAQKTMLLLVATGKIKNEREELLNYARDFR